MNNRFYIEMMIFDDALNDSIMKARKNLFFRTSNDSFMQLPCGIIIRTSDSPVVLSDIPYPSEPLKFCRTPKRENNDILLYPENVLKEYPMYIGTSYDADISLELPEARDYRLVLLEVNVNRIITWSVLREKHLSRCR